MNAHSIDSKALPPVSRPWYRERWPWFLMLGPAIVIVGGAYAMWLAVATDDGVIAEDYYKRGLSVNERIERAERAAALNLAAEVSVAANGEARVVLQGSGPMPDTLRLKLVNATRTGLDRSAILRRDGDHVFVGRIEPPPPSRWLVSVDTEEWRLPTVEATEGLNDVRLASH